MIFSSIPFLYYFLPIVLFTYFVVKKAWRNKVLLFASLFFYAWGEPKYVFLMITTIILGYFFGLQIEKYRNTKKATYLCISAVFLSLLALGYFKYADFFILNLNHVTHANLPLLHIVLPIGISFYTFQIISYIVDVYRGEDAQHNLFDLGAYIAMFPQLIAGPIIRYADIDLQLQTRKHSIDLMADGIVRFIIGLSKKVLLANQFGLLCTVFRQSLDISVMYYWMYILAFSFQLYFDFSGYSDMAIGLGKMFGFHFMENFNYPYIANSITDFWRRWHISLGTWFRDYVYIPLGGNRVSTIRQFINIFIVWFLTGFWHGANWNFILWGLYFALLLMIEKVFLKKYLDKHRVLSHIYVILMVFISFVIFNGEDLNMIKQDLMGLFGLLNIPNVSSEALYYLKDYGVLFLIAFFAATPLPSTLYHRLQDSKYHKVIGYGQCLVLLILLFVVSAYLVDGSFNPFLYFRF